MSKREEQAASDWKLSEADKSSGCVVDGTVWNLTLKAKSQPQNALTPQAMNIGIAEDASKMQHTHFYLM
jgi:hypothetical protein